MSSQSDEMAADFSAAFMLSVISFGFNNLAMEGIYKFTPEIKLKHA